MNEFEQMCLETALRYNTSLSRAMLRALGINIVEETSIICLDDEDIDEDIAWCFKQRTSPMDGRF